MSKVWSKLHVVSDSDLAAKVKKLDADVVVLVAKEAQHPGEDFGVEHVLRCPLPDDPSKPLSRSQRAAADTAAIAAATAANEGRRVVVSCMRGLDRSPFIAALAMIRGGVDVQKAIARVQKARPGALERNKQLVAALRDG